MEKPFALDPDAVAEVTAGAKKRTQRRPSCLILRTNRLQPTRSTSGMFPFSSGS